MSFYKTIIEAVHENGGDVISEIFVNDALQYGGSPLPSDQIYARDISMIKDADVVIAEVTNPSLGVGYELAFAEQLHKPILCLFNAESQRKLSAMIEGNAYNKIAPYRDLETIHTAVNTFLK